MSKRILITGVSGFVGTNLSKYLNKYASCIIVGVSRNPEKCKNLEPFIHRLITYEDLFNEEFNYEVVIHLAGQVIKKNEGKNSEDIFRDANYLLTKRIFDLFRASEKTESFLFLSSIHVLTEIPTEIITEDYIPEPFTPYGRSKYEAECYIQAHDTPDKHIYILRPTMIHGEGNRGNLKSLYNYLLMGGPYLLGKVNNKRSFLSIENLSFVISEAINRKIESGTYHVADDDPTYTHELIDLISELSGKKIRKYRVPLIFIRFVAKLGNYLPIPFDMHRYGKLTSDFLVDNQKIKKAIGKPLPISADEGIRRTIRSFIKLKSEQKN